MSIPGNRRVLRVVLLAAALTACGYAAPASAPPAPTIIDRPIPFSEERVAMTQEYILTHYGLDVPHIRIVPRIVVLHWTAIPTLEASFNAFAPESLPGSRTELAAAGQANVSTHFLVDRDGTVYRLMPEDWMARHVIGLNYSAIGIENVGGSGGAEDLTEAQVDANVDLIHYLAAKYPTIQYLIGHSEYRVFEGHPLWRERDEGYRTEKIDPGSRFLAAVRARVAPLGLNGPEEIAWERRVRR